MNKTDQIGSLQESLELISRMINHAKTSVKMNSFYILLWGWVALVGNLGMFALMKLEYHSPHLIWLITIPAWIISLVHGFRSGRRASPSHFARIIMWLWIGYGIIIFTLVGFGHTINYHFNPIILIITAIPTFTSGIIFSFRPLIMGGIAFWLLGMLSFTLAYDIQLLVSALAVIAGYLIPGYALKYSKE